MIAGSSASLVAVILMACVLVAVPVAEARIEAMSVNNDGRRAIFVEKFGFAEGGTYELTVTNFKTNPANANPEDFGFFIRKSYQEASPQQVVAKNQGKNCLLHEMSYKENVWRPKNDGIPLKITIEKEWEGIYETFFLNCNNNARVSFDLQLVQYNVGPNYLSIGEAPLPWIYGMMALAFLVMLGVWLVELVRNRVQTRKIHHLFTALIILKTLSLFFEALKFQYIKTHGHASFWDFAFYFFHSLKAIMVFVVILLVGTGWGFLKPFLSDNEKKIFMVVIPLQVIANIAVIILDETMPGEASWLTWADILRIFDLICCCAVLFPIVWSIRHLQEASATDGKAARNMSKLKLFRQFYVVVVAYIYCTRILVFFMSVSLPYRHVWISNFSSELAAFAFYIFTGYKFRPVSNNPYFLVESNDIDEEEEFQLTPIDGPDP
eukprot:TRINITY_DN7210_c0_g1_i1.p1 TRINITY_DN7210_c0_g1~~TRINITY_DN7210_c0_g1_i1.p1  ORF type:complete len:436 (-),score=89.68 TRINITY_DN7210_c0_g1_i1:370-1677(-)